MHGCAHRNSNTRLLPWGSAVKLMQSWAPVKWVKIYHETRYIMRDQDERDGNLPGDIDQWDG